MKKYWIIIGVCCSLFTQYAWAGPHESQSHKKGSVMQEKVLEKESTHKDHKVSENKEGEKVNSNSIKVGNRICPVSNEWIPEGEEIKYEYEGKIYNLCCKMCAKDFKKNPIKFSNIAEKLMLKEHGTTHEKKMSPDHAHDKDEYGHGNHQDGQHDHECEGSGCTE